LECDEDHSLQRDTTYQLHQSNFSILQSASLVRRLSELLDVAVTASMPCSYLQHLPAADLEMKTSGGAAEPEGGVSLIKEVSQ
jgi:hypothetical protein